jgi:5-methylcytosine-specific restriction endonuclease McrA
MTHEEYKKHLRNPKWYSLRIKVLVRDKKQCVRCGNLERLEIHHKRYLEGEMPWDTPIEHLETLCFTCHQKEHNWPYWWHKRSNVQSRK